MLFSISQKIDKMKEIHDEVFALKKSPLYLYRTQNNYFPVIGEGSLDARIIFIGEAPGKTEAETSHPFCGRSGKFLDEMLESIHLKRSDIYITNLVKDRPPENRDPTKKEIALYASFLDRQIKIIQPKVIVTLGRLSMAHMFNTYGLAEKFQTVGKIHGLKFSIKTSHGDVIVVPLYHPAVALYNGSHRATLLADFQVLKKYV